MRKSIACLGIAAFLAVGCEKTLSERETTKRNSDGTVTRTSETVKEKPDGTVTVEKEKQRN
jgi:hypothetical protein